MHQRGLAAGIGTDRGLNREPQRGGYLDDVAGSLVRQQALNRCLADTLSPQQVGLQELQPLRFLVVAPFAVESDAGKVHHNIGHQAALVQLGKGLRYAGLAADIHRHTVRIKPLCHQALRLRLHRLHPACSTNDTGPGPGQALKPLQAQSARGPRHQGRVALE